MCIANQLYVDSFEAFNKLVEGLEKASRLIACSTIVEFIFLHSSRHIEVQGGLEEELCKLYRAILHFFCCARKLFDKTWQSECYALACPGNS